MIEKKTAQLYWVAGKGGALIGKGSHQEVENLAEYGKLFGLMFQIKDDLLNILTDQTMLGKQKVGSDIPNGKRTLMVIHTLSKINTQTRKRFLNILGNTKATQQDIYEAIDIFKDAGSIEYSINKLKELRQQAWDTLEIIKPSESKLVLQQLADYSITRKY